eukprot:14413699-Ditylum_brightwellii.AAC.1
MKSLKGYQNKLFRKTVYKCGVQVTRTGGVIGAMKLDKENGNSLWFDAQKKESSTLRNMDTFKLMPVTIGSQEEDVWSGVVNTESVCTAMFLAMLNGMSLESGQVSLLSSGRKYMDLIGSYAQLHCQFCIEHGKIGFKPSKANPDLWMRDAGDHYKYIDKYIDNILIILKDLNTILDLLEKPKGPYESQGVKAQSTT